MSRFFNPRFYFTLTSAVLLAIAIITGCTYSHGDAEPCGNATTTLATYRSVVSPIFDQHCRVCHGATYNTPGDPNTFGGGIPFRNYQDIVDYNNSTYILCCIQHNGCDNMPKIGDKLSDCDIARIKAWFDAGLPNN